MQTYLYRYHFEGREYAFEMPADSKEEADARVAVLSHRAQYVGELAFTIPADIPFSGWLVRAICAVRNFFAR